MIKTRSLLVAARGTSKQGFYGGVASPTECFFMQLYKKDGKQNQRYGIEIIFPSFMAE
jgi:hypothetical protein